MDSEFLRLNWDHLPDPQRSDFEVIRTRTLGGKGAEGIKKDIPSNYIMRVATLLAILLPLNLGAEPKVASSKVVEVKKSEEGRDISITTEVKYEGGWIQLITTFLEKEVAAKTVTTYDDKGQMAGMETMLERSNAPMTVGESRKLLAGSFQQLTGEKFDPDDFLLGESVGGQNIMGWRKKRDDGQLIFAYETPYSVGCYTQGSLEASENDLIPK